MLKKVFMAAIALFTVIMFLSYEPPKNTVAVAQEVNTEAKTMQIKILIGDKTFDAVLFDNAAARAFYEKLPLNVTMTEFNGNEKFYSLDKNLPSLDKKVDNIRTGDLMLWLSNTVVLFYQDFYSGYNYTRLGKIKNPEGLLDAVGSGNISVKFEK